MVNQKLLSELETIILEDYGVELQPQALAQVANTLVNFFQLLGKIERQDKYDNENFRGSHH